MTLLCFFFSNDINSEIILRSLSLIFITAEGERSTASLSRPDGACGFKLGLNDYQDPVLKVSVFLKDHGQYVETYCWCSAAPCVSSTVCEFSGWPEIESLSQR